MSSPSVFHYPDIVKQLLDLGAWLVPLRGRYGVPLPQGAAYDEWKQPTLSWKDRAACTAAVLQRRRDNHWVGLIPSSMRLVVLDVDEGNESHLAGWLRSNDYSFDMVATRRGWHFFLRAGADWPTGNWKWALAGCSGDIRFDAGYVVVWKPDQLLVSAEMGDSGVADAALAAEMGYKSIGAQKSFLRDTAGITPERYPPGDRDAKLLEDLLRLVGRRGDTPAAVEAYRQAWLSAPMPKPGEDRAADFDGKLERARAHIEAERSALLQDGVFPVKSEEVLRQALATLGVAWAYNIRSGRFEYKQAEEWLRSEKSGAVEGALVARMAESFKVERPQGGRIALRFAIKQFEQYMTALVGLDGKRAVDDFLLWIERKLPAWDGEARIEQLLIVLFGAKDNGLTRWAGRYLFLAPLQRAYQPGCKLDEIPVLIGEQGWGKSALLSELFPAEFQDEWFTDQLDMTASSKEKIEATRGSVLVEVAEMAGVGRDWQRQKAYLSARTDKARLAYDRASSNVPRRFGMVGTADRPEVLPNDPAGNRRFVGIQLYDGAHVEAYMDKWRLQVWAEALFMYKTLEAAGETRIANLPRALMDEQAEANEQFRYRDDEIEDAVADLPQRDMTYAEICEHVGLPKNLNRNQRSRLTNALQQAGWRRVTPLVDGKRRVFWRPPQSRKLV